MAHAQFQQRAVWEIGRQEVYSQPYRGFGKLAPVDKLAFSAASLALETSKKHTTNTAIVLSTTRGSYTRDQEYWHSVQEGFARPALFSATLPSSPIAEIAINFHLTGANRVLSAPSFREYHLLLNALMMLKKESSVLLVSVDEKADGYAAALLLGAPQQGGSTISVKKEVNPPHNLTSILPQLIYSLKTKTPFTTLLPHTLIQLEQE